jgi:putative phosphoribosyl transferase
MNEMITSALQVLIPAGDARLAGDLSIPEKATGIVIFAHGSGSSRHSPRNQHVAAILQSGHMATLLLDLLTAREEAIDAKTADLRFDITLLRQRLIAATQWVLDTAELSHLPIGYFGASTGAAAALAAAAEHPDVVRAIVSRGGRPDLTASLLPRIVSPTLLIVGSLDTPVIELNRKAYDLIPGKKKLEIIAGASHLFEETGKLDLVASLARDWFQKNFV